MTTKTLTSKDAHVSNLEAIAARKEQLDKEMQAEKEGAASRLFGENRGKEKE